jgi:hypothetical protein
VPVRLYSIDTSALVHGWRRAYRPKNFPFVWDRLDALIQEGRLRASIEVLNELARQDDELLAWCKDRREAFVVEIDDACQVEVARIMGAYPRLVDTVKGRSGADPWVIALAATEKPRITVVTEENPGKQRIPERIPFLGLADLIEEENWHFG